MIYATVIQARMGSRRFPGKAMAKLRGTPILARVVERCRAAEPQVIVATTAQPQDDVIRKWCDDNGVPLCSGSEDDVLSRFVYTAKHHLVNRIIRVNADCPFIEPTRIDQLVMVDRESEQQYDYIGFLAGGMPAIRCSVALPELVGLRMLQRMHAYKQMVQEHVTWACHQQLECKVHWIPFEGDYERKWTVDEPADLKRLEQMCMEACV